MESCFVSCSCGSRQAAYKMQNVNNRLVCKKCAKIAEAKKKRENKRADEYQVVVTLLDGTRLFYQPIGGKRMTEVKNALKALGVFALMLLGMMALLIAQV